MFSTFAEEQKLHFETMCSKIRELEVILRALCTI